jgi:hypothetical protein
MEAGRFGDCEFKEGGSIVRLPLVGDRLCSQPDPKTFLRGGRLNDHRASRWSAVKRFGRTTKQTLDTGGLLMEVARHPPVSLLRLRPDRPVIQRLKCTRHSMAVRLYTPTVSIHHNREVDY